MEKYYHLNYYFNKPKEFSHIKLVQIGRLYCDKTTQVPEHIHLNWFELTIVTDGEGVLTTNDVDIPIKRGDIYLSFPADRHSISTCAHAPLRYDFFSFYTDSDEYNRWLEKIMQAFGNPQSRIFSDENIQNLVQNSISEFSEESRLLSDTLLTHSFEMILIYLLRNFPTSPRRETLAKVDNADIFCYNIMNYIDTHIFTMKNLEELSEVTNYNYSYLSSLFRKTTGRTLVEYYQSSRFRIARSLVMENKVKISDIAALLNYSSVYAFSKAYKKEYGVCPRESKKSSFLDP